MIEMKTLSNGVRLITEEIPQMQAVSVGIWVRTGAVNETPDLAGISHFIEHMTFKGTKNRTARQIAEDMDKIGGQMNAFTGKEATCYYMKTLASHMEEGLEILFDMFTDSLFDETEMDQERKVIYEEMKMIKDAPDEDALDTIGDLVLEGSPLGNSIIGTEESLAGIDREKMVAYYKAQYTRDSIYLAAAGKIDKEKLEAYALERLSGMRERKDPPLWTPALETPKFISKARDIEQAHLCLGRRTLPVGDERVYAYMIINNIMGGSMSSRLFQHVREQKGLAYSVYSSNSTFSKDGEYVIYAGVDQKRIPEAMDAIREELSVLKESGVTEEEVAKAKEKIKSNYIFGQDLVDNRMMSAGRYAVLTGKTLEAEDFLAGIDAVTEEELKEAAETIGDLAAYSAVLVSREEEDLERLVKGD